jgi:hypothetical protein
MQPDAGITAADFTGPTTDEGGGEYERYVSADAPDHDPFADYPSVVTISPVWTEQTIAIPMGVTYSLAHNLDVRRQRIWVCWPGVVVGWIGDTAHQAECSDHNPDSGGVVHAIDPMVTGARAQAVVDQALAHTGDLQYVIHNRVIWSRTAGFAARKYTGSDPHTDHVHISGKHGGSHSTAKTCTGYDLTAQAANPTFDICGENMDLTAKNLTDIAQANASKLHVDYSNPKSGLYADQTASEQRIIAAVTKAVTTAVASVGAVDVTPEQLEAAIVAALKTLAGGQA